MYEKEFKNCKNENTKCTPYTLLRLFIDIIPNLPDKLLYLDIDIMFANDIKILYDIDFEDAEYIAVPEKYANLYISKNYINAGVIFFNLPKIKETGLLKKSRELIKNKKLFFADQSAINKCTVRKKMIDRRFNEQHYKNFNREDTVVCHFCQRFIWWPWFKMVNIKQWQIDDIHKYYKCYRFDKDLEEYLNLINEFDK